ncbi:MAG: N-acetyl sugar amidotransferase [Syntrophales bacterium]|nr:N-acetyl sugar amidotransferase [Syntrophales bacterium]MDY0043959.1 N-acetyl sugar amidotransferase [Syntrophales bacterium]
MEEMRENNYRICTRCIMDTSDPEIMFDGKGVCNHCREFDEITRKSWFAGEEGKKRLSLIINAIKSDGNGNEYDCIIGLSGGIDSSYMAVKVHEWGLRPLVVHVDAGWNSELAVSNIEKIVKYCDYHLHTHVVNWEEMRDLQLAYLRSGIANQDVPQDHVFFASMYQFAVKHGIRYILSGGNIASESIFPKAWHGSAMDAINLKAIHRKYGERPLNTYTTISFFEYYIWYPFFKKLRTVRPLNYMNYNKMDAIDELTRAVGWRAYGRKHCESLFTKLFQNYYLPVKFGYDKRRPHLSSLIVAGQITREEALHQLDEPLYDKQELEDDINYFCKKMRISKKQFNDFISAPPHHYRDFKNWERNHRWIKKIQTIAERSLGRNLKVYS